MYRAKLLNEVMLLNCGNSGIKCEFHRCQKQLPQLVNCQLSQMNVLSFHFISKQFSKTAFHLKSCDIMKS